MIKKITLSLLVALIISFILPSEIFASRSINTYLDNIGAVNIKDDKGATSRNISEYTSQEEKDANRYDNQALALVSIDLTGVEQPHIDSLIENIENVAVFIESVSYYADENDSYITMFFYGGEEQKEVILNEVKKAKVDGSIMVSENKKYEVYSSPNDTRFASQWSLSKMQYENLYGNYSLSSTPVIAILDTGVNVANADIVNKLWTNSGEVAENALDDDGNGYIDDVHGCNFFMRWEDGYSVTPCRDSNLSDGEYFDAAHGSYVAEVAAAETNNSYGIAGTCPECEIMVLDVSDDFYGFITDQTIFQALVYAANNGADVVNMSLGTTCPFDSSEDTLSTVMNDLINTSNISLVQSGGNTGDRSESDCVNSCGANPYCYSSAKNQSVYYVSGKNVANNIFVGSTDSSDMRSYFSSYSASDELTISAPGENIITADGTTHSGTSFSAPTVSGAVGMLVGKNPSFTSATIFNKLKSYSDTISTDYNISGRRLNLYKLFNNGFSLDGIAYYVDIPPNHVGHTPVYRFSNLLAGGHFYTASESEKDTVVADFSTTFSYEGIAFYVDIPPNHSGLTPVYRFSNLVAGGHFYTASESEKDNVIANYPTEYFYEGIAYYVNIPPNHSGHTPVYRFGNLMVGGHFYTASEDEKNTIINE